VLRYFATVRAVQFSEYGPATVLQVVDVAPPHAGPGEIRIAVRASSLSPGEMRIRSGVRRDSLPAAFPFRTGFEAAGVVDELGDGVRGVSVGDEVFGYADTAVRGTNADSAVLVAWAPRPATWTWAQSGAAAGSVETATRVLDRVAVRAGDTLLVQGASGSVGSMTVQLAVARGAHVIGTASEPNLEFVRSLGARPTTHGPGLADRVRALVPAGVDAVVDCAGGTLPDLVAIAGGPARVVTIADLSARAHGVHLSHGAPPAQAAAMGVPADPLAVHGLAVPAAIERRVRLQVPVAATFPLDDVVAAASLMEDRHGPGKIALIH
jgi:NADPH:quinone reductase-like Zn-dependent oxidoreductase